MKAKFFEPLQMSRTLALEKDVVTATNAAKAYTIVNGELKAISYAAMDNLAPAASISSSVNDMSHWVIALLDSGKYAGRSVIPYRVIHATRIPQIARGLGGGTRFTSGHFRLYALGWDEEEYDGRLMVSHTGGVNGFVSSVTLLPEENLGIVVLTNTDHNSLYEALKYEIMDACLGFALPRLHRFYFWRATNKVNKRQAE